METRCPSSQNEWEAAAWLFIEYIRWIRSPEKKQALLDMLPFLERRAEEEAELF